MCTKKYFFFLVFSVDSSHFSVRIAISALPFYNNSKNILFFAKFMQQQINIAFIIITIHVYMFIDSTFTPFRRHLDSGVLMNGHVQILHILNVINMRKNVSFKHVKQRKRKLNPKNTAFIYKIANANEEILCIIRSSFFFYIELCI